MNFPPRKWVLNCVPVLAEHEKPLLSFGTVRLRFFPFHEQGKMMLKFLSTFAVITGLVFGLAQTTAYSEPVSRNAAKKTSVKKTEPTYADNEQPDIAGMASSIYNCELGNKLAIFQDVNDNGYVALRWQNRLHRLLRVKTSTGADRFENQKNGLVWISIPSKGMLLDSNKGRQLANECKTKHQMKLASK